MSFTDKMLTCVECGTEFVFTAGEQEFHASKGFTNQPRRCSSCRLQRRAQRDDGGMGGGYGAGGGGAREYFSATCASCGREARVPFQPRGDKPVYCSDCFRRQSGGGGMTGARTGGGYGGGYDTGVGGGGGGGGGGGRGGRDRDRDRDRDRSSRW